LKDIQNYPVYTIGVVSELLGVHPETIRTWEKAGVGIPPQRRGGKRFYSEREFKQLRFIQKLVQEGLTLRAIRYYLRLYPCWKTVACVGCLHSSNEQGSTKPCWQEIGTYCQLSNSLEPCNGCENNVPVESQTEVTETEPDTLPAPHKYNK